jgi:hypothetical protein
MSARAQASRSRCARLLDAFRALRPAICRRRVEERRFPAPIKERELQNLLFKTRNTVYCYEQQPS